MGYQEMRLKKFNIGWFPPFYEFPTLKEASEVLEKNEVCVVAVEGAAKDWAAYCETPSSKEKFQNLGVGTFSQLTFSEAYRILQRTIAEYGQKLRQEEAELLFPEFAEMLTWRR